jgi:hypothetical protein
MAAPVVLSKMNIDDVLDSLVTVEKAITVREQLTELLRRAGFQIRRWCSNRTNVLKGIPEEDRAAGVRIEESKLPCVKTLGVKWDAAKVVFQFAINADTVNSTLKNRGLLRRCAIRANMALQ